MLFGLSRKAATEFSFYLAIPTLIGAGVCFTMETARVSSSPPNSPFAGGLLLAFASALTCIRWLIRYISTHDFTVFGLVSDRLRRSDPADGLFGLGRLGTVMD